MIRRPQHARPHSWPSHRPSLHLPRLATRVPSSRTGVPPGARRGLVARLALVVAVELTLAAAAVGTGPVVATATNPPTASPIGSATTRTESPRVVELSALSAAPSAARPPALTFHPRDPDQYARAKANARMPRVQGANAPRQTTGLSQATGGPTEQVVTGFPGMSYSQQISLLGGDQTTEPPDTQLAAGPSSLVMVVNASGSVWTKTGTLTKAFDLNAFFGVPAGYYFGDPRAIYDAPSGRWFISGLSFDLRFDSQAYVATSTTSDPSGSWYVFTIESNAQRTLYDQPKLGVSDDKIVVSWSSYANGATSFQGQETWVLQKSDLVAGRAAATKQFGPDVSHFDVVPSQALGATTTAYAVYNNADPAIEQNRSFPSLGLVAITGTPAQGNVAWTEWDLPARATTLPPAAAQPGSSSAIETNDDRLLSAVWQNGVLWAGGNDGCVPTGDTSQRACLRLFQVSTATPALLQDFDVGLAGADLYFPALGLDARGNLFAAFTESSATTYASAATAAQMTTDPVGSVGGVQIVERGLGTYTCGGACGSGPMRWGDYSAAAPDPVDPTSVWVAAEFAASGQNGGDWGTGIGRVGSASTLAATPTPGSGNPPGPGSPPPGGTPVPGNLKPQAFLPAV